MSHVHMIDPEPISTIKRTGKKVHKCLSCQFKCTADKIAEVRANPQRHRIIRKTMPAAKVVYGA